MSLSLALSLICGLLLYISCSTSKTLHITPRQTISYQNDLKSFRKDGVFNYSTMLIREDLGLLVLGAKEAIYALDLNDIRIENSAVYWRVTDQKQRACTQKGKQAEVECQNYIRTLHSVNKTTIYVCGTNAFSPTCDYMTLVDGQLKLNGKQEDGKGKCPYDPFQRYSSLMVESDLYSATSMNFLGSELVLLRSSPVPLRTENNNNWLNKPSFVHMEFVGESFESQDADDKIYLFFSENAREYDFYSEVVVSRVARVCKGDMGGGRLLGRKWTSFLKARLDCSLSEASLPSIVQDVFLLEDDDWRNSVFYAVFTLPSSSSPTSLVCKYSVPAIRAIFDKGKFKTSVVVETSYTKWLMYSGTVPTPRPGACVSNSAQDLGDKTLSFIKDHQLMDEGVKPMTDGPLLVVKGPLLTRIVVDRIVALDGQSYNVMFVGTENGFVNKAVNYNGEMFIIEEVQLYKEPVPITTLRLSQSKGQIYAGSQFGAVQMPVSNCSRYATCVDCVLAKDPYCAWDLATKQCSLVTGVSNTAVQSLKEADCTRCPPLDPVMAVNLVSVTGNNIQLMCQSHSNLAQVHWRLSGRMLSPNDKYYVSKWGLVIVNATTSDAGLYICESVEQTASRPYSRTMGAYQLQLQNPNLLAEGQSSRATGLEVAVILLSLLCFALITVLIWTWFKGHLRCVKLTQTTSQSQAERQSVEYMHIQNRTSERRRHGPQSVRPLNANNNHSEVDFKENGGPNSKPLPNISTLDGLGYIHHESEI